MFKNLFLMYLCLFFLLFSNLSSFAQNREGWEFLSWDMKMRQVQDSLTERKIFYTYDLNEGKGTYIKFKIADYEAYEVNLFFHTENQLLYQVNTKRKFSLKENQEAEIELERVVSALREAWGAPIKETMDKTAPFCQYEIVWELEKNLVSVTYCKTSSISLTINYNKRS